MDQGMCESHGIYLWMGMLCGHRWYWYFSARHLRVGYIWFVILIEVMTQWGWGRVTLEDLWDPYYCSYEGSNILMHARISQWNWTERISTYRGMLSGIRMYCSSVWLDSSSYRSSCRWQLQMSVIWKCCWGCDKGGQPPGTCRSVIVDWVLF